MNHFVNIWSFGHHPGVHAWPSIVRGGHARAACVLPWCVTWLGGGCWHGTRCTKPVGWQGLSTTAPSLVVCGQSRQVSCGVRPRLTLSYLLPRTVRRVDSVVVSTVAVASIAWSSIDADSLCFCSYHFINPKSYQFAHIIIGDGQLSVIALAVGSGDQPYVMCLAVAL